MLDTGFHQGASLHCNQPQDELRLLVVTSPKGARKSMETLWQICRSLQNLGYPVAVLDAMTVETDYAPGLQQMLVHAPWGEYHAPNTCADASSITVVPAALGLLTLINAAQRRGQPEQTLEPLEPIFRRYSVVVVHAPMELLTTTMLTGSPTTPLLLTEPGQTELVECYRQLKHLTMHAGLTGVVAYMVSGADTAKQAQARENIQALERCVMHHLGQRLRATLVYEDHIPDLQRLALLLLENAGAITAPNPMAWPPSHTAHSAHSASTPLAYFPQSH